MGLKESVSLLHVLRYAYKLYYYSYNKILECHDTLKVESCQAGVQLQLSSMAE